MTKTKELVNMTEQKQKMEMQKADVPAVPAVPATTIYEGKNSADYAKKAMKETVWKFGKQFPIMFWTGTKRGTLFSALHDEIMNSPTRSGIITVMGVKDGKIVKVMETPVNIAGVSPAEIGQKYADFFGDVLLPAIIAEQGKIQNEVLEKKKIMRPAGVYFVSSK